MKVYLAGPLFSEQDRKKLEEIARLLAENGIEVYLPHRDAGDLGSVKIPYGRTTIRERLFARDVLEVKRCDLLVALLDGADVDSGTAVEIGIAHTLKIPVIGLKSDFHRRNRTVNNMIWGACRGGNALVFDVNNLLKQANSLSKQIGKRMKLKK